MHKIKNNPISEDDATNKEYVDSKGKTISWADYQALTEEEKNNGTTYFIPDMPVSDTRITYSTDEIIVGTWIDNRPIYRKVIDLGTLPNANTVNIPHNIDNLDRIISISGMAKSPNQNLLLPFPYGVGNDAFNSDGTVKINGVPINIYEEQGNIVVYTLSDRSDMTGYVILEYIKTTD